MHLSRQVAPAIVWSSPSANEQYTPGDALVVRWKLQGGKLSTPGLSLRICAGVPTQSLAKESTTNPDDPNTITSPEETGGNLKPTTHSHHRPIRMRKRDPLCATPMFPKVEQSADGSEFSTVIVVPSDLPVSPAQSYYVQMEDSSAKTYASPGFAYHSAALDPTSTTSGALANAQEPGSNGQTHEGTPNSTPSEQQPLANGQPQGPPSTANEQAQPVTPAANSQQPLGPPQAAPLYPASAPQSQPAPIYPGSGLQQPFDSGTGLPVQPIYPNGVQNPPVLVPALTTLVAFLPSSSPSSHSGHENDPPASHERFSPVFWAVPLAIALIIIFASLLAAVRYRKRNTPQLRPLRLADPEKAQELKAANGGFDYGYSDAAPVLPSLPRMPPPLFIPQLSRERTAVSFETTSSGTSGNSPAVPPGLQPQGIGPPAPPPKDAIPSSLLPAIPPRAHIHSAAPAPIMSASAAVNSAPDNVRPTDPVAGSAHSSASLRGVPSRGSTCVTVGSTSSEKTSTSRITTRCISGQGNERATDAYAEVRAAIERGRTPMPR